MSKKKKYQWYLLRKTEVCEETEGILQYKYKNLHMHRTKWQVVSNVTNEF